METSEADKADTHLANLLGRVANGEIITLTMDGVPIATLQPPLVSPKMSVSEAIEQMFQFRKGNRLNGLSIREMINEGRR
jgi:antitoxin (DNA-binding transcriptional repressor) of toxin-antitoxin stability system